jgi:hypothetical protein
MIDIFVTDQQQEERLTICGACEHYTSLKFCSQCNCFMPVKSKLASKKCPLDKWLNIENDKDNT